MVDAKSLSGGEWDISVSPSPNNRSVSDDIINTCGLADLMVFITHFLALVLPLLH
jgi:hypothetical protein